MIEIVEPLIVVCARCADMRKPAPNAERVECSHCSAACWLAQSSKTVLAQGAVVECFRCAMRHEAIALLPPSDETLAEIIAARKLGDS